MLYSKRSTALVLGLAIVAGFSGWYVAKNALNLIGSGTLPGTFITSYATDITYIKINPKGMHEYKISAKNADYYQNKNIKLKNVIINVYAKKTNGKSWLVTSNNAMVTKNMTIIYLYGNVKILEKNNPDIKDGLKMNTESIYYYPKTDYIKTNSLVYLSQEKTNNTTTGKGFTGYLKTGNFALLNNVRTHYDSKTL